MSILVLLLCSVGRFTSFSNRVFVVVFILYWSLIKYYQNNMKLTVFLEQPFKYFKGSMNLHLSVSKIEVDKTWTMCQQGNAKYPCNFHPSLLHSIFNFQNVCILLRYIMVLFKPPLHRPQLLSFIFFSSYNLNRPLTWGRTLTLKMFVFV